VHRDKDDNNDNDDNEDEGDNDNEGNNTAKISGFYFVQIRSLHVKGTEILLGVYYVFTSEINHAVHSYQTGRIMQETIVIALLDVYIQERRDYMDIFIESDIVFH